MYTAEIDKQYEHVFVIVLLSNQVLTVYKKITVDLICMSM